MRLGTPYQTSKGYIRRRVTDANGNLSGRSCFEHIIVAEEVLGHPLPRGAVVHHINGVKTDNRRENLLVCQDQAYHMELHRRARAYEECGNPDYRQCFYCRRWDSPDRMQGRRANGSSQCHHLACAAEFQREYRRLHPKPSADYPRSTADHCRWGHPWTDESTRIDKRGCKVCRVCERERYLPARRAKRAA